MKRGLFIVFEGIDGCGKTSQARRLKETLKAMGHEVVMTEEPQKNHPELGTPPLGAWVREQMLHQTAIKWDNWAVVYMLLAARVDHIQRVILPALEKGKVVICDRFSYSTLAYQGYGMGGDVAMMKSAAAAIEAMVSPDRVFLIDIDPMAARVRLDMGRGEKDSMEQKPLEFFEKVRLGFLTLAKQSPHGGPMKVIDGLQSQVAIAEVIKTDVEKLLQKK